jgi:hypothetical protein
MGQLYLLQKAGTQSATTSSMSKKILKFTVIRLIYRPTFVGNYSLKIDHKKHQYPNRGGAYNTHKLSY